MTFNATGERHGKHRIRQGQHLGQNADLQHAALKAASCKMIFTDHGVSGTRASRPELDKLLEHLRDDDEVVVWKLDRLGRNTRNLLALIDDLEGRGVHFRNVTEGISTMGPMGKAMLTVMSAFAQLERDQLAERTKAGMAAADAHGCKARRREISAGDRNVKRARELKVADIGKIIGASRTTVYRYLQMELPEAGARRNWFGRTMRQLNVTLTGLSVIRSVTDKYLLGGRAYGKPENKGGSRS